MATMHVPGTGIGPGRTGRHGRRTAAIAGVVLACTAIAVPFALHGLQDDDAPPTTAVHQTGTTVTPPAPHHHPTTDRALGSRADLPPLLPDGAPGLQAGRAVRVGDVTEGSLRRTSTGWQVVVRWDGRLQPLPATGPVTLGGASSWVSRSGLLYTRVATGTAGRFRVFEWDPEGGSAYAPPSLVATPLGLVCFNASFTAFGNCHAPGAG